MPSAKTIASMAASASASAMVIRSIARELIPYQLRQYVYFSIRSFFTSFSPEIVLIIEEFHGLASNQIYKAADIYLRSKMSPSAKSFTISMLEKEAEITTTMARNQEMMDRFDGVNFKWRQISRQVDFRETGYYELCFHKKHKQMVFDAYFPYILKESKRIKEEKKTLKIHALNSDLLHRSSADNSWSSMNLDHLATFDTLAMNAELKNMIMDDLKRFVKRREYYRKVGRPWKRGYLLYGPPGPGKSSLIAAMANYLNFDIYEMQLAKFHANSELRRLLISTKNRSILVFEDIDCSFKMEDRKAEERAQTQAKTLNIVLHHKPKKVTLSGLLNFIDGLWSSCGDESIIIFTTNHKDGLDPALLRPGRMDLHISVP